MPITPFHFGPGAAIHSAAPRRVSFIAFCTANVLIDIEPFYYMLTRNPPLHRFFHTSVGATLVVVATAALFLLCRRLASRLSLPDLFGWQSLSLSSVIIGAAFGAYTHLLLDGVMHADIRPFAPFTNANPLLGLVSLPVLHLFCIACGVVGVAVVTMKNLATRKT